LRSFEINVTQACVDGDSDGYSVTGGSCGTVDCNDGNNQIYPGAADICDGEDNDCDAGTADGSGESAPDNSNQNGVCLGSSQSCVSGTWQNEYLSIPDYEVIEITCDSLDNDCDLSTDEGLTTTYFQDNDNDNFGNATFPIDACSLPVGYVADNTDCNDNNIKVNPDETEICNGYDDNCDLGVDEGGVCGTNPYYCDNDTDTFNDSSPDGSCTEFGCVPPAGCSFIQGNDCDDANISIYFGALESCNLADDNCDGNIDEGVEQIFYYDEDADGWGVSGINETACSASSSYVSQIEDCRPTNSSINPGATEFCNGYDDNCDLGIDEGGACSSVDYYCDGDTDGEYSLAVSGTCSSFDCAPATCVLTPGNDCDDSNISINPSASEICGDGADNNCVGGIDDGCPLVECIITDIYWNTTLVDEDEVVELIVEGTGCENENANFTVWEYDGLPDEVGADDIAQGKPIDAVFSQGLAITTWLAEWHEDGFLSLGGDPEYYFEVRVNGTDYESGKQSTELLSVNLTERKYKEMNITLHAGKNAFSLPLILDNMSIDSVFEDISSNVGRVYTYEGHFMVRHSNNNRPGNLQNLEVGRGYIIEMNSDANLTINGTTRDENLQRPSIHLAQGWNMMGTFSGAYLASDVLRNVDYSNLYVFNEGTGKFDAVSGNPILESDKSYWIKVNVETDFVPLTGEVVLK